MRVFGPFPRPREAVTGHFIGAVAAHPEAYFDFNLIPSKIAGYGLGPFFGKDGINGTKHIGMVLPEVVGHVLAAGEGGTVLDGDDRKPRLIWRKFLRGQIR